VINDLAIPYNQGHRAIGVATVYPTRKHGIYAFQPLGRHTAVSGVAACSVLGALFAQTNQRRKEQEQKETTGFLMAV
jgi:hypothetical protein